MKQQAFRELISGGKCGLGASLLRCGLMFCSWFYSTAVRARNLLYDNGGLKTHRVGYTVISVGNITAGGTGKTPLVIWIANMLSHSNARCFILTRGYKSGENKIDEPAILSESCPEAEVIVNPDRVAGAVKVVRGQQSESSESKMVFVMDDGFQHRRLARDLDILTIDATCPFGFEKILPAGLLREPLTEIRRGDVIVMTRCDQVDEVTLKQIEERVKSVCDSDILIAKSSHVPIFVKTLNETQIGIEELKDKMVFAFCGIGNPQAFLKTVASVCGGLTGSKIYDDHHKYTVDDIDRIYEQAQNSNAELILTTQKDFSKCNIDSSGRNIEFAYLAVELKITSGEDKLRSLIEETIAGKISHK